MIRKRLKGSDLPDLADLYTFAYQLLDSLPASYGNGIKKLTISIENFASILVLDKLNMSDKYELLGLYQGIPINEKINKYQYEDTDIIYLYRGPLIRYSRDNNRDLKKLVECVLLNEVSHHFGLKEQLSLNT